MTQAPTIEQRAAEFQRLALVAQKRLLALHTKLDAALLPGGRESDAVPDLLLTKGELALLIATIEQSL